VVPEKGRKTVVMVVVVSVKKNWANYFGDNFVQYNTIFIILILLPSEMICAQTTSNRLPITLTALSTCLTKV